MTRTWIQRDAGGQDRRDHVSPARLLGPHRPAAAVARRGRPAAAAGGSYSYRDLLELRVIKTLLDAGIRLESVREVFTYLRQHVTSDIASAHIVISGNQVVLCDGDELIDVLRRGQGVLNVLPLAGVKDDIDAQLVPLGEGRRTAAAGSPRRAI